MASTQLTRWIVLTAVGISPLLINGVVNAQIAAQPAAYWTLELLVWVVIPLIVLTSLRRKGGLRLADLGFQSGIFGRRSVFLVVLMSVVFCWLSYTVYTEAYGFMRLILSDVSMFSYKSVLPQADPGRSIAILYFALSAGFVEEIYFRGLLFRIAASVSRGIPLFLLLSPILFAAIHWESGVAQTAAAYVFGLLAAVAYVLMRNIWPLVVGHIFTDCLTLSS